MKFADSGSSSLLPPRVFVGSFALKILAGDFWEFIPSMFVLTRPNGSLSTFYRSSCLLLNIKDSFEISYMLFESSRFFMPSTFSFFPNSGIWTSFLTSCFTWMFSVKCLFFMRAWSFSYIFYYINPAATPVTKAVLLFFTRFKSSFSSSFLVAFFDWWRFLILLGYAISDTYNF